MKHVTLCKKLVRSQGKDASDIMSELGTIISTQSRAENKELAGYMFNLFESTNLSRQTSLAYLITLCKDESFIVKLFASESIRIREAVAKGLAFLGEESFLDLINDFLVQEPMYRVKKWLLIALKNCNSERSLCLLSGYDPEPELFLEHLKLIDKPVDVSNVSLNISAKLVVQVVPGFEKLWLDAHSFSGVILSPGFVKLTTVHSLKEFESFRDVFAVGFVIDESDPSFVSNNLSGRSLKILFSNVVAREKTLLNSFAYALHKKGVLFSQSSLFALQVLDSGDFLAMMNLSNDSYEFHLPASISRVVASSMSLLEPEHTVTVLDPCCGAGTLLIEHQKRYSFSKCIGLDISKDALHMARANAKSSHTTIATKSASAKRIPFNENSFDRVVCNPPFDKRVKIGDKDKFYFALLKQIQKVLKLGGVAIIYTVQKNSLKAAAQKEGLKLEQEIKLNLEKIQPSIFILRKVRA